MCCNTRTKVILNTPTTGKILAPKRQPLEARDPTQQKEGQGSSGNQVPAPSIPRNNVASLSCSLSFLNCKMSI